MEKFKISEHGSRPVISFPMGYQLTGREPAFVGNRGADHEDAIAEDARRSVAAEDSIASSLAEGVL